MKKFRILVASRDKRALDSLVRLVDELDEIETFVRHLCNGHPDPLHGLEQLPDVLVLRVSESWRLELDALQKRQSGQRSRLIVVAPSEDPEVMRQAMRAGARDFLFEPLNSTELAQALSRAGERSGDSTASTESRLIAFINAKGGSGATTLACNVAHLMSVDDYTTVIVDLDMQFGTLPAYLDLQPKHDLIGTLRQGGELDAMALNACMAEHSSGLRVLGSCAQGKALHDGIDDARLDFLFDLLQSEYERIVVDLPRQVDTVTAHIAERADFIVVVVQQSFANLRDAARLLGVLRKDFSVPDERLLIAVNRFDKKSAVSLADVHHALHVDETLLIPNDYRNVCASINTGVPLHELVRNAAVTKALATLQSRLSGRSAGPRRGVIARTLAGILRT